MPSGLDALQTKQKQKLYPAIWTYFSVIQKLEWSKEFLLVVHPAGLRHSCTKASQASAEIYAVWFTEQNKKTKWERKRRKRAQDLVEILDGDECRAVNIPNRLTQTFFSMYVWTI